MTERTRHRPLKPKGKKDGKTFQKPEKSQKQTDKKPDPRFTAFRALQDVMHNGVLLDEAMDKAFAHPSVQTMETRDRGLARLLVTTVLRYGRSFHRLLKDFLDRPIPARAKDAELLLLLGAAQLLVLKTPAHAAINTTVDLAKINRKSRPMAGMINAVLRKVAKEAENWSIDAVARQDVPGWLWRRWSMHASEDELLELVKACLSEPPLDLTVKPGMEDRVAQDLSATLLPTGSLRLSHEQIAGPIDGLPGFQSGDWWVQDAAASIPVRLMGELKGRRVIDLCAAPGGKTMQLASAGADVTALDISKNRLDRIQSNLARTGLKAEVICGDATKWMPETPFDGVLLDAPCTATGTLRRHPDKLWHGEIDVTAATEIQDKMLDHAVALLNSRGTLLYCTCSLEPEEGEERIAAFLDRHANMKLDPIDAQSIPGIDKFVTSQGWLRIRPDHWADNGGIDGFFAARLLKG